MQNAIHPDWHQLVHWSTPGPQPELLHDDPGLRVLVAGLEPGAGIPPHPGPRAVYHYLEGEGVLILDGVRHPVSAGMTVVAPAGAVRGMEAVTRLAFLGVRLAEEPSAG
ncbi:MAG: cupin domain-containing protein [Chloroflexota bacterium]